MTTLVDVPSRVDGVQLIGEMVGSGYRTPPALVRRADGQVLQLTPLLYLVLNAVDGRRSCAEVAELVSRGLGRGVSEAQVAALVDTHLRPLGLLRCADGSEPELRRSDPLLGLKLRVAITSPRATRRITDPFRLFFRPAIVTVFLVAFVAVVAWVFFERGLGGSAYDAFQRPHLLLLVFVVSVLSGGLHEFGHAAAARYGGAQPGRMGAGLYLVWPAFYTDVTDSYRLGRGGRIRTDLGGLYFNAIVAVLTFVWWWSTGWEALLLLVATQVLQMVQQLLPLLRFDGYHLLADLAGVPDLYQRIRPTLVGLLPHRWKSPENRMIKPWARIVITLWVFVTIPLMVLMLVAVVAAVPRLVGSAGAAIRADAAAVARAWTSNGGIDVAAHSLQVLSVVLPILACAMILSRVGFRFFAGLASWSRGSWARKVVATGVGATAFTMLLWAWWPHPGAYRPIEPDERGTLAAILQPPGSASADSPGLTPVGRPALTSMSAAGSRLDSGRPLTAVFEAGEQLPTKGRPTLAMVLVPTDGPQTDGSSGTPDGTWVFPFDQPLPPSEGDNQALAVATKDGSVSYDIAFAMVWAEGDEVLNVNEAHAYASCSDCVAVAVAFQVVLILDDARVVVPQNLAVAANYDCYRCITAAIASQLVVSLDDRPDEAGMRALADVWNRLTRFARTITSYSLTEITAQLETFKAEIAAIVTAPQDTSDAGSGSQTSSVVTESGEPSTTATASSTGTTAPASSSSPSATGSSTTGSLSPTGTSSSAPSTTDSSPSPSVQSPTSSSTPVDSASPTASPSP